MVALAGVGRRLHLAQQRVHLLGVQPPPGAHRAVARQGAADLLQALLDPFRDGLLLLARVSSQEGVPTSFWTPGDPGDLSRRRWFFDRPSSDVLIRVRRHVALLLRPRSQRPTSLARPLAVSVHNLA